MRPHTTGAGQSMEHHQGHTRPVHRSGAITNAIPIVGAPSRAASRQCELPLFPPSPTPAPARSRAERVAAFMRHFFNDEPSVRELLEATAAAEERRRGKSRAARERRHAQSAGTLLPQEGRCPVSGR